MWAKFNTDFDAVIMYCITKYLYKKKSKIYKQLIIHFPYTLVRSMRKNKIKTKICDFFFSFVLKWFLYIFYRLECNVTFLK